MKLKKPTDFTPILLTAVGLMAGAMASRVVVDQISSGADTSKATMYKSGVALAGGALAAFTDGKDTMAVLVKSAGYGMLADQALSTISLHAKGKVENPTVQAALGLGCGCDDTSAVMRSLGQGRVLALSSGYELDDYSRFRTENAVGKSTTSVLGI